MTECQGMLMYFLLKLTLVWQIIKYTRIWSTMQNSEQNSQSLEKIYHGKSIHVYWHTVFSLHPKHCVA